MGTVSEGRLSPTNEAMLTPNSAQQSYFKSRTTTSNNIITY